VKRRKFITLLGGEATWPLEARAQQSAGKPSTIGYLGGGGPTSQQAWLDAFVQRLRERGWIAGRTVAIEVRWGEGRPAADQVRFRHQPDHREGTGPDRQFITLLGGAAAAW
jgi:hypothetical protein